jgi:ATP-dependent helicase HrpB
VRIVVDSGLARVPRFEPAVGLTRLETVRVSRASAEQRRGRAGRTEPGVCYRLWDEAETRSLVPFATPEILAADLSSLALDLAVWGITDPARLAWLDPPPAAAVTEARALLRELGAIDGEGRVTALGRRLAALPLPPRLSAMIVAAADAGAAGAAAEIAVVLSERGLGGDDVDLAHRLDNFRRDRSRRAGAARAMAERWATLASESMSFPLAGEGGARDEAARGGRRVAAPARAHPGVARKEGEAGPGALLALAYPDRVAKARAGRPGAFLLENGRGAALDPAQALAREPYLAVAEVAGSAAEGRILLAAKLGEAELARRFASRIEERVDIAFDENALAVRARAMRRLGALTLAERPIAVKPGEETARMLADGIVRAGLRRLPWGDVTQQWLARVRFMRKLEGAVWPDTDDAALAARRDEWLVPLLAGKTAVAQISDDQLLRALRSLLPHELARRLDIQVPTHFATPTGSRIAIDYTAEGGPSVAIKVQELFGLGAHPKVADGRVPLTLSLLSPAGRPIQVTKDLPSFWRGSWTDVKKEMRGRYPRHSWPDDPLAAAPTRRAKPRR